MQGRKVFVWVMLAIIAFALLSTLFSCEAEARDKHRYNKPPKYRTNVYWAVTKHTATGKHTYMKPYWCKYNTCKTYVGSNPIKYASVRIYKGKRRRN